jgi:hypothetical protein
MKKPNHAANTNHPIHHALEDLHLSVIQWLHGVRSSEVAGMLRSTRRACRAVEMAATGTRRKHYVQMALEKLRWTRTGFRILLVEGLISESTCLEARAHLSRMILAVEQLGEAEDGNWSTVELPPLEVLPTDSGDDALIKRVRRLRKRFANAVRPAAERDERSVADADTPAKNAA